MFARRGDGASVQPKVKRTLRYLKELFASLVSLAISGYVGAHTRAPFEELSGVSDTLADVLSDSAMRSINKDSH